jgi:hypothetical protein
MKKIILIALAAMLLASCGTTKWGYTSCPSHDPFFFNPAARPNHGPTFGR